MTERHGGGRAFDFVGIASRDDQQLALGIEGIDQDIDPRRRRCRQAQAQGLGAFLAGDQHHGIALGWQGGLAAGKARAAIAGQGTEPGRQGTGGFQGAIVGRAGDDEGQLQLAGIAAIEERLRQACQVRCQV